MNNSLAPEPVLRASLQVMHFAAHITRNWLVNQDVDNRERIQALWEAVYTMPNSLKHWRGDESLLELRARLRDYDSHWNFPKLDEVFNEALNDPRS